MWRRQKILALVDPLVASADEIRALEALGPPTHVLLTCNWHLRNAEACRRLGQPHPHPSVGTRRRRDTDGRQLPRWR